MKATDNKKIINKDDETLKSNALIAKFMGADNDNSNYIEEAENNALIATFMGAINHGLFYLFKEPIGIREEHDEGGYLGTGAQMDWRASDMGYSKSYDWLIPAFDKFCIEAEALLENVPRTRNKFCTEFMDGVWRNDVRYSYKALVSGIKWLIYYKISANKQKK